MSSVRISLEEKKKVYFVRMSWGKNAFCENKLEKKKKIALRENELRKKKQQLLFMWELIDKREQKCKANIENLQCIYQYVCLKLGKILPKRFHFCSFDFGSIEI